MSKQKFKCGSFFAGVGGIDLGFERTGYFETVYANEFDRYPADTYELNSKIKVDRQDIKRIDYNNIPDFDILLAGFPCQAFSVAGYQQGFDDEKGRGTLIFDLLKIINIKKPSVLFLENVKNLVSHNKGQTLSCILKLLKQEGYYCCYKILNAMEYGNIPQNRERVYIVCFRDKLMYDKFTFPKPIKLTKKVSDIIDFNSKLDDDFYYTKDKFKGNLYEKIASSIDDENAVYQWRRTYLRKNKNHVIPTLTANQGAGGHNVCIIKTKTGIRKMTPKECFLAQGFSKSFKLPTDQCNSRLYKQAGNSVCVSVIKRIATEIYNVL